MGFMMNMYVHIVIVDMFLLIKMNMIIMKKIKIKLLFLQKEKISQNK
jgi:hypothetical protein